MYLCARFLGTRVYLCARFLGTRVYLCARFLGTRVYLCARFLGTPCPLGQSDAAGYPSLSYKKPHVNVPLTVISHVGSVSNIFSIKLLCITSPHCSSECVASMC